ncbi:MAG TPA: methylated-DNA--[protein]-cysteine S-methyltransferase [Bacteroidales bacterium]|nr:methylated-DNA--[protein]-cysteine S-methyltransferase [Bacteroidales bacterium]
MKATILPLLKSETRNLSIYYSFADSRFARLCLASTDKGLCWVSLVLGTDAQCLEDLQKKFQGAALKAIEKPLHTDFLRFLEKEPLELTFHLLGTPFQLDVWKALLNIPFGGTTSYGALAVEIGRPKAFRAVGSAVGDNPIFYAVPCHRVLPASGGVGQFFWGPEIKKSILDWEKAESKGNQKS